MALTKFGTIYSTGNAIIRRYVYLDNDSEYAAHPLSPGESLVLVSIGPFPNSAAWQVAVNNAVTTASGKAPGDPYCAVVNTLGVVIAVIMADPAIDTYWPDPTCKLVSDPTHTVSARPTVTPKPDFFWTWTAGAGFAQAATTIG